MPVAAPALVPDNFVTKFACNKSYSVSVRSMSRRRRPGRPPLGKRAMTAAERTRRHRLLKHQQRENTMTESVLKVAPPLPETRSDLLAQYKLKRRRSINDLV